MQVKLDKMRESKLKLDQDKENCPLIGGARKPLRPGKHVGMKTFLNQFSDILLLDEEPGRKEKIQRRLKRQAPDESVYRVQDQNGYLERFKDDRPLSRSAILMPRVAVRDPSPKKQTSKLVNPAKNTSEAIQQIIKVDRTGSQDRKQSVRKSHRIRFDQVVARNRSTRELNKTDQEGSRLRYNKSMTSSIKFKHGNSP